MSRTAFGKWLQRMIIAVAMVLPGLAMCVGGVMTLVGGTDMIPGGSIRRRLRWDPPPRLPAQQVEPGVARFYAGAVTLGGLAFVGLGVASALGHLDAPENGKRRKR